MKKIAKIFVKVLVLISLTCMIAIVRFVFYLETSIDKVNSPDKQGEIWSWFNESDKLPEKFYVIVEKYYPRYFNLGVWESELRLYLGFELTKSAYNQLYISRILGYLNSI